MKKRSNSIEYQKSLHTSPGVHPDANRDDSKKEWAIGVKKNKFTKDRIFPTNTPTTDPSKGLPEEGIGKGMYRIKADNPSFEGSYWFHSDNFNDDETNKRPIHPEPDYLNPNDLHTGDDYVEIHGVIHPSERLDYNINNNSDSENYDEFGNPYLDKKNASHLIGISNISTNLNVQESKISKNNDIYTIKEQYKHIYKENKKNMKPNVKEQINRINQMIMFEEGMSYNDVKLLTEENIESGDGDAVAVGVAGVADGGDIAAADGGDIAAADGGDIAAADGGRAEMVSGPIPTERGDRLYAPTDIKFNGQQPMYQVQVGQDPNLPAQVGPMVKYSLQPQYEGQQPVYPVLGLEANGEMGYSRTPQFEGQPPMYQVMAQGPDYDPNLDYTEKVGQAIQDSVYSSEPQFEGQQPMYQVPTKDGSIQYSSEPQFEGQQPMYQVVLDAPQLDAPQLEVPFEEKEIIDKKQSNALSDANSQLSQAKLNLQRLESDIKNYEEFYGVGSEEVRSTKSLISKVQSEISALEQLIAQLEKGEGGPKGPYDGLTLDQANSQLSEAKLNLEKAESDLKNAKTNQEAMVAKQQIEKAKSSISYLEQLIAELEKGDGGPDDKKETARVTKSIVKGGSSKRGSYTAPSYGPTSLGANSLAFGTAKSAYNPFGGSETGKFSAGKTANLSRGVRGQLKDMSKAELLNVINQLSDNQESDNQEKEELNESRKLNKKMIRLTEADLYKIVDRVIREKKKF